MQEWIVGLDLRPSSQGALEFAKWLQEHGASHPEIRSVHVMEDAAMRVALRADDFQVVQKRAEQAAQRITAERFEERAKVSVVRGTSADKSLTAAAQFHHARGIIIGRQAYRDEDRMVMLGRVARRLVRNLPTPVFVVPPDLRATEVGEGPVLVAIDMDDASVAAVDFAREFATEIGRSVELVHVMPLPEFWGEPYAPIQSLEAARDEIAQQLEPEVRVWLQEHGLDDLDLHFRQGYVTQRIATVADETKAPTVVCGSRHLGLIERWFLSSVGSALAGAARIPVAVVPGPTTS